MTTFVDLYFPPTLVLDRDEVQSAIEHDLPGLVEVVGAGTGLAGSNIDLELIGSADSGVVLAKLARTLTRLGVPDETMVAVSQPREKIALGELRRRTP